MNNRSTSELNSLFGQNKNIHFREDISGLTLVELNYHNASLKLHLQGAHITSYRPTANVETLWMSNQAIYQSGKALRGGIPLCWPWFGPGEEGRPQHGYARTSNVSVLNTGADKHATSITLGLDPALAPYPEWKGKARLEIEIRLSDSLWMEMRTENSSESPLILSNALHTYYSISNRSNINIPGLTGLSYRDKLENYKLKKQSSSILINKEIDRVYLAAPVSVNLSDEGRQSNISIKTWGNNNLVVWNPGEDNAKAMSDFDDQGFEQMLCIEPANALDQSVEIKPGEVSRLGQEISYGALDLI